MSKIATECTYALTDVVYETELVEVSDAIMSDVNSELQSGGEIPLPYKSWRSHSTGLSGSGTKHQINISESAINLEAIYSVIKKQSHNAVTSIDTAIKTRNDDNDPFTFTFTEANTQLMQQIRWLLLTTAYKNILGDTEAHIILVRQLI